MRALGSKALEKPEPYVLDRHVIRRLDEPFCQRLGAAGGLLCKRLIVLCLYELLFELCKPASGSCALWHMERTCVAPDPLVGEIREMCSRRGEIGLCRRKHIHLSCLGHDNLYLRGLIGAQTRSSCPFIFSHGPSFFRRYG